MEIGLGLGHIVLDGEPASPPPPKGSTAPLPFSTHVCCGQTAGWIEMPLGTEVGLDPGDIILDGDPAPLKRDTAPTFRPISVANRRDGSRCHLVRSKSRPRRHCVRWGSRCPRERKGVQRHPHFRPTLLWHGRPSQQLLSSCSVSECQLRGVTLK